MFTRLKLSVSFRRHSSIHPSIEWTYLYSTEDLARFREGTCIRSSREYRTENCWVSPHKALDHEPGGHMVKEGYKFFDTLDSGSNCFEKAHVDLANEYQKLNGRS